MFKIVPTTFKIQSLSCQVLRKTDDTRHFLISSTMVTSESEILDMVASSGDAESKGCWTQESFERRLICAYHRLSPEDTIGGTGSFLVPKTGLFFVATSTMVVGSSQIERLWSKARGLTHLAEQASEKYKIVILVDDLIPIFPPFCLLYHPRSPYCSPCPPPQVSLLNCLQYGPPPVPAILQGQGTNKTTSDSYGAADITYTGRWTQFNWPKINQHYGALLQVLE